MDYAKKSFHENLHQLIGLCETDDSVRNMVTAMQSLGGLLLMEQKEIWGDLIKPIHEILKVKQRQCSDGGMIFEFLIGGYPQEINFAKSGTSGSDLNGTETIVTASTHPYHYDIDNNREAERWKKTKHRLKLICEAWLAFPVPDKASRPTMFHWDSPDNWPQNELINRMTRAYGALSATIKAMMAIPGGQECFYTGMVEMRTEYLIREGAGRDTPFFFEFAELVADVKSKRWRLRDAAKDSEFIGLSLDHEKISRLEHEQNKVRSFAKKYLAEIHSAPSPAQHPNAKQETSSKGTPEPTTSDEKREFSEQPQAEIDTQTRIKIAVEERKLMNQGLSPAKRLAILNGQFEVNMDKKLLASIRRTQTNRANNAKSKTS